MFNNVTRRQQHSRWSTQNNTTTIAIMLLVLVTTLLVSNALALVSTLTKSEIDDLNTIEFLLKTKNASAAVKQTQPETRQYPFNGFMMPALVPSMPSSLPGCPLCDSSVYSYCSHKLIHDSCCCDFPGYTVYQKPPQCAYYDCTLLYAKTCYEHLLVKNCCCYNPY